MPPEGIEKTDEDLVRSAKGGNDAAFSELVRRHMERAIQTAFAAVGNYEDAKDVSQEAFVKAHHHLKRFRENSRFFTWYYRILMNTAKDHLKKRKWGRFLSWQTQEEAENFFEAVPVSPGHSPRSRLEGVELDERISAGVQALPFKQKWVFTLRFLEDVPVSEIAKICSISEATVRTTLHFAVQKFKTEIEKGDFTHASNVR